MYYSFRALLTSSLRCQAPLEIELEEVQLFDPSFLRFEAGASDSCRCETESFRSSPNQWYTAKKGRYKFNNHLQLMEDKASGVSWHGYIYAL
jgi:hypothetical protein